MILMPEVLLLILPDPVYPSADRVLSMAKGSWTKNDGAGSGSYYFILAFYSVEDLIEGMCQGVFE